MDISDGLAGDLAKMMRASGVSAEVETVWIPLSPATKRAIEAVPELIDTALTGGDDYEILCAVPRNSLDTLLKQADGVGVALSVIGRVVAGHHLPVFRTQDSERRFDAGSYSHF